MLPRGKKSSMTKTDCFAYDERKCKALKERYCDFEKCNFYKTKSEVEKFETSKKVDKGTKNIPQ